MSAPASLGFGPFDRLRLILGAGGLEVNVGDGPVYVKSTIPFIVGPARHAAGFPHRIQARELLRLWPMGDHEGALHVYR